MNTSTLKNVTRKSPSVIIEAEVLDYDSASDTLSDFTEKLDLLRKVYPTLELTLNIHKDPPIMFILHISETKQDTRKLALTLADDIKKTLGSGNVRIRIIE